MKANELMIGDRVCYNVPNKYYTKVEEIRGTSDGEEYYIRCHRDSKDTYLEQLKHEDFSVDILHPIPLTPEILEKNGFVGELCSNWIDYVSEEYKLRIICKPNDEGWTIYANHFGLDKKDVFVHELQHALRLCGIEKEIIL